MRSAIRCSTAWILGVLCLAITAESHAQTLLAHYDFDDGTNLGLDSSAFGNNATTATGVTQVADRFGDMTAGFFNDGSTNFRFNGVMTGDTADPNFTITAWVNRSTGHSGFDGIVSQDNGACCETRLLMTPTNSPFINVHQHSDRNLNATVLPTDEWFHIALTGENVGGSADGRVYVNGVEVTQSPQSFAVMPNGTFNGIYVGAGEGGAPHRLLGALDDVMIFEGALDAQQINDLFQRQSTQVPEPASIAVWSLIVLVLGGLGYCRYTRSK